MKTISITVSACWLDVAGAWHLVTSTEAGEPSQYTKPITLAEVVFCPKLKEGKRWQWTALASTGFEADKEAAIKQAEKRLAYPDHRSWCDARDEAG